MSPPPVPLRTVSATDVGRVRDHQEDTALVAVIDHPNGRYQLLLVADGMGGGIKGEVASALASETVLNFFQTAPWYNPVLALKAAAAAANAAVFDKGTGGGEATRSLMGTTLVVALVEELTGKCWLVNVGDSRAYLLSGGVLEQITQDHSLVAERIRAGMEPLSDLEHAEWKNTITRAVGIEAQVEADVSKTPFELKGGDRLLLCSDGLHGMVDDLQLAVLLSEPDPEDAARAMVSAANVAGGRDNISVVIGALGDTFPLEPTRRAGVVAVSSPPGVRGKLNHEAVIGRSSGRALPSRNTVLLVGGLALLVAGVVIAAVRTVDANYRLGVPKSSTRTSAIATFPPAVAETGGFTPFPVSPTPSPFRLKRGEGCEAAKLEALARAKVLEIDVKTPVDFVSNFNRRFEEINGSANKCATREFPENEPLNLPSNSWISKEAQR